MPDNDEALLKWPFEMHIFIFELTIFRYWALCIELNKILLKCLPSLQAPSSQRAWDVILK